MYPCNSSTFHIPQETVSLIHPTLVLPLTHTHFSPLDHCQQDSSLFYYLRPQPILAPSGHTQNRINT